MRARWCVTQPPFCVTAALLKEPHKSMLEALLLKIFTGFLEKVIHTKVIKFLIIKVVIPQRK